MNSRDKGKRGELEYAKILREHGYPEARRGQQHKGGSESPDVIGGPIGYHFEVKRVEKLNIHEAMKQSVRDSADGDIPVVVHRKNDQEWLATLRNEDFLGMVFLADLGLATLEKMMKEITDNE